MDDKDRTREARGAEDALRPHRPGGERKSEGETDQRPDPANAIPDAATDRTRSPDERAAGHIDDPIHAGDGGTDDYQTGDRAELAQQRSGPVDISRDRPKRR